MRLVHYLRKEDFDTGSDFASPETIDALRAHGDLWPVNRTFTDRLRPVHARYRRSLAGGAASSRRQVRMKGFEG